MEGLGVNICIIDDGKILLTRREDFEVWCLPGGAVDPGESIAQAAVREALEETGLEVELTNLVGIYSRPDWDGPGTHIVSFTARVIGGTLTPDPNEVIETGYFGISELPDDMIWWHRQRMEDALNGVSGIAWRQEFDFKLPKGISREELYAMRDASGLSRSEFYEKYLGDNGSGRNILEIGSNRSKP